MRRPRSSLDALPPNQKRLVAVEFGGGSLVNLLTRRIPATSTTPCARTCGAPATPTRACGWCSAWSACSMSTRHHCPNGLKSLVRVTLLLAPILVSLGFFLSVPPQGGTTQRAHQPGLPGGAVVGGRGGDPGHRPVPGLRRLAGRPVVVEPPGMADGAAKGDDANTNQGNQRPIPAQGCSIVGPVPNLSDASPVGTGEA
jgi:hypothetical protein